MIHPFMHPYAEHQIGVYPLNERTSTMTSFDAEQIHNEAIRKGEADPLASVVFQALGAASVCWDDMSNTGVFQDAEAKEIGDSLLLFIRNQIGTRDHAEVYRDAASRWRYRIIAGNGRIVDSSQGYSTKWGAKRAARRGRGGIPIKTLQTIKGR